MKAGDAIISGLPLFHGNALVLTGITTFMAGGHVILCSPAGFRDMNVLVNFYKIVSHYKATAFSAVPTLFEKKGMSFVNNQDLAYMYKRVILGLQRS